MRGRVEYIQELAQTVKVSVTLNVIFYVTVVSTTTIYSRRFKTKHQNTYHNYFKINHLSFIHTNRRYIQLVATELYCYQYLDLDDKLQLRIARIVEIG